MDLVIPCSTTGTIPGHRHVVNKLTEMWESRPRPLTQPECYWANENQLHLAADRTTQPKYLLIFAPGLSQCKHTVARCTNSFSVCVQTDQPPWTNTDYKTKNLCTDTWSVCSLCPSPLSTCIIFLIVAMLFFFCYCSFYIKKPNCYYPDQLLLLLSIKLTGFHIAIKATAVFQKYIYFGV